MREREGGRVREGRAIEIGGRKMGGRGGERVSDTEGERRGERREREMGDGRREGVGESERQRGRMQDAGRVRGREREVKREGWGSGKLRMEGE